MYRKALTLTLLGVLLVGGATILYGSMFNGGLDRTIAALSAGDEDHDHDDDDDHDDGRRNGREWRDDD